MPQLHPDQRSTSERSPDILMASAPVVKFQYRASGGHPFPEPAERHRRFYDVREIPLDGSRV